MFVRKQAFFVKRKEKAIKNQECNIKNQFFLESSGLLLFFNVGKLILRDFNYYFRFCFPMGLLLLVPCLSVVLVQAVNPEQYIAKNLSKMTIFFQLGTTESNIQALQDKLSAERRVSQASIIWANTALSQLGLSIGIQSLDRQLDNNPLPHVIILTPAQHLELSELKYLYQQVKNFPSVSKVNFDIKWLQRVINFWSVLKYLFCLSVALLAIILLIVIEQRFSLDLSIASQDIKVMRVLGITKLRVSLIYIYKGIWCGLLASFWTLSFASIIVLSLRQEQFGFIKSWVPDINFLQSELQIFVWMISAVFLGILGAMWSLRHYFARERIL